MERSESTIDEEDAEAFHTSDGFVDASKVRYHKRIERNARLSKDAKKIHGHACQVCGIDFKEAYGPIGEGFIEAHHLRPVSKLEPRKTPMSPKEDFAVLCPNCHRMIHRFERPEDIAGFIEYIRANGGNLMSEGE